MEMHKSWCRRKRDLDRYAYKASECNCDAATDYEWQKPIHWEAGDSIAAQVALKEHPFQGPDKIRGGKIWGAHWSPINTKPWKPAAKPTATTTAHVELSQQVFESIEGYRFTFWSLAPIQPGVRSKWKDNMHCEFVWMILEGTNGRGVHIGLVDPNTSEVRWWRSSADYFVPGCEEVVAS